MPPRYMPYRTYRIETDFFNPRKIEKMEIEKMLKLNSLPSLLYRVHFVHTIKQTPRQKWLRHYWLCPPTPQSKKSLQKNSGRWKMDSIYHTETDKNY